MIRDVAESSFQSDVIDRSHEVPVVVDFWAEWCGPCRRLTPALEAEATKRGEGVDLAKVDVDANQGLAASFGVQGIPAVKAFRNGEVVAEFTGAIPPAQVSAFFDGLAPSEAQQLAGSDNAVDLRRALELDPRNATAAVKLARILIASEEPEEARSVVAPFEGDFGADGIAARLELADAEPDDQALGAAFSAWDAGDHPAALEALQSAVAESTDSARRDRLRRVMVAIFTELGAESELAREHRRRLALALT